MSHQRRVVWVAPGHPSTALRLLLLPLSRGGRDQEPHYAFCRGDQDPVRITLAELTYAELDALRDSIGRELMGPASEQEGAP